MVDYSINYCVDLRNGRCSSVDRPQFQHANSQRDQESDNEDDDGHHAGHHRQHRNNDLYVNIDLEHLGRPSCPPVLFVSSSEIETHSEGNEPVEPNEGKEDPDDQEEEDEEEFYDCEDENEYEYEEYDDEEDSREGVKRISSASRSPAPEHVQDGAQAELDAEVEISEVIALRYSRFSLARQTSVLKREETFDEELKLKLGTIDELRELQNGEWQQHQQQHAAATEEGHVMMKRHLNPICTIGEGAFGRVQLCQHRENNRYYALKSLYIPKVIERKQVDHVHAEKRILQALDHPFIVKLWDTAKDSSNLYMVMEFLPGGELFSYFRTIRKFTSSTVKFYTAEIVLALEYLHSRYIAYRDLKPENLMVSLHGHIKLTDFGFAKIIHNKSYTLCGTPGYLAPEVFERKGHNHAVDWWSLGVLIFELIAGEQPFRGKSPEEIFEAIQESKENGLRFPKKTFSPNAKVVIKGLLRIDIKDRLTARELKGNTWFSQYQWDELYHRNYKPPFLPTIYHEGDTGNFDSYQEMEQRPPAKQCELDLFDEW